MSKDIPTIKQKAAASRTLENLGKEPMGTTLKEVGYSDAVAKNPKIVTESDGFKAAMAECGLTESLIANALTDDIKAKEGDRVQELKLGAEILGMKKKDAANVQVGVQLNLNNARSKYA